MSSVTFVHILNGSCLDMKRSVLLVLLFTCVSCKKHVNVGTVLFAASDAHKDCWSADSLALLTSRMILESVLPAENSVNVNNDQFVREMVAYFRLTLDVIRENTSGKTKHIMLMALTDVLGNLCSVLVLNSCTANVTKRAHFIVSRWLSETLLSATRQVLLLRRLGGLRRCREGAPTVRRIEELPTDKRRGLDETLTGFR